MDRQNLKKTAVNALKILVSALLLSFVFTKIPFREVTQLWKSLQIGYLFLGAVFFLASQFVSAQRLGIFLHKNEFPLSYRSNLELYFLGMFYNFFIPGGIGGDAYKIYLLNKKFGWSAKKLTSTLFADRLSGLIAICLIICVLGFFSLPEFRFWVLAVFVAGFFAAFFVFKKMFKNFGVIYWQTLGLSTFVQLLQLVCFIFLLKSIGVSSGFIVYSLLFLASSVLSLISFAGIGVREMLFLQASKYFEFSPGMSVSASLLFTVITAFFSFFGLFFQLRKLNLKTNESL